MKKPLLFILSSLLCFSISTYSQTGLSDGSSHASVSAGQMNILQSGKNCAYHLIIDNNSLSINTINSNVGDLAARLHNLNVSGSGIAEKVKLQNL